MQDAGFISNASELISSNMEKKMFLLLALIAIGRAVVAGDTTDVVYKGFRLAEKQYTQMLTEYTDLNRYPRSADPNGHTSFTGIEDWTGGFWPGCLWYVYEYTGDEKWKNAALRWTESLERNQFNTHHHDIGFVMNCSYGNAYRLTKDTSYKSILIQSARSLITRFDPKVGAIKSWNTFNSWDGKSVYQFPVIIDNMMNLELLFLATKLSGDDTFKDIAIRHAETTLKNHYRPDYSSYHVVNYDPQTGKVLSRETAQGFSDNSAWARGQAWGLYGYTLMYRETKDKKYLDAAIKMAEFFIHHEQLPEDHVPYWDFNVLQDGYRPNWPFDPTRFKEIPRDASAAAITSSALLELVGYIEGRQRQTFRTMAESILSSLGSAAYSAAPGTNGYFILKHSVGSIPHNGEIDVPLVYADYYYLEALKRLDDLRREDGSRAQQGHLSRDSQIKDDVHMYETSVYPGFLHTQNQLAFVQNQLKEEKAPWIAEYNELLTKANSYKGMRHHAVHTLYVPKFYEKRSEHIAAKSGILLDGHAAYTNALAFALNGDADYARNAILLLNAWAETNGVILQEDDSRLVAAYGLIGLLAAADILMGEEIWPADDKSKFRAWLKETYLPALQTTDVWMDNKGNWGTLAKAASYHLLGQKARLASEIQRAQTTLEATIAKDGHLRHEVLRGEYGLWYTYFSLTPITLTARLALNSSGKDLLQYTPEDGGTIKQALDYLFYYSRHAAEWPHHDMSGHATQDPDWPSDLFIAMDGYYNDAYGGFNSKTYLSKGGYKAGALTHSGWFYPVLMRER